MFDFSESPFITRLVASLVSLITLTGVASVIAVFSMMLVLFSADSGSAESISNWAFRVGSIVVAVSLVVAVSFPPIMLLCRLPTIHCLVPAGIGFAVAGITTLWIIVVTLGNA